MAIDITTPHVCRIYDYVLGGSHNHEVDRRAAEAMIALLPAYPRWARQNRAFLGRLGRVWAAEGRTRVLDLGSSLPTQGHFNACMPGAKILFSDIDPLTVAQAQQILAYSSDMAYVEADVREPEQLVAHAEAFFGDERVLGVGFIGLVPFLSDDQVRHLVGALHAFCAPGSKLAVTFPSVRDEVSSDDLKETLREMCRIARVDFFHRTPEQIAALLAPWRVTESQPLSGWLSQEEHRAHDEHPMDRLALHGTLAERD